MAFKCQARAPTSRITCTKGAEAYSTTRKPARSSWPGSHTPSECSDRAPDSRSRRARGQPDEQKFLEATRLAQDIPAAGATASADQRRRIVWSVFEIIRIRQGRIVSVRPRSTTAPLLALTRSILRAGNGGYGISFDFESEAAYRAWDTHPEHERIRREAILPLLAGVVRCQFRL
jgi:hypothetical protein